MRDHKKLTLLTLTIVFSLFMTSANAVSYFILQWQFPAYGQILPHALDTFGNVVYYGSAAVFGPTNYLYARNVATGEELWHYNTSLPVKSISHFDSSNITYIVAGTGGSTSQLGSYVLTRRASPINETFWKSVNLNSSVTSVGAAESSVIGDDDVVAGLNDGFIVRFLGINGSILWKYPANGSVLSVSGFKGGGIIAGSLDSHLNGHVYSLNMNGTLRWSYPPSPIVRFTLLKVFSDVTGDGLPEVIVVFADGRIHVLNGADGQEVRFYNLNGDLVKDLLSSQDYTGDGFPDIIVGTDSGNLVIFNGLSNASVLGPTSVSNLTITSIQYMYFYQNGAWSLNKTLAVSVTELGTTSHYYVRGVDTSTLSVMKQYSTTAVPYNLQNIGNFTSNYTGDLIFTANNVAYNLSGTDIIVPEFASNFILISLIISIWFLLLVLRKCTKI